MREIRIVTHVRGIAAAELEPGADKPSCRRPLHGVPARDRPGEGNEIHARVTDDALRVGMAHVQCLERSLRQPCLTQALFKPFCAQRCLRRVLEHDDVARHERRHDAVHGNQVRVIPRGDGEHHAEGLAAQEAMEPRLGTDVDVGEGLGRDGDHVTGAFERPAHFVRRIADRPTHLPGQFLCDVIAMRLECVAKAFEDCRALSHGYRAPDALGEACGREGSLYLDGRGEGPLDVDASVDRGDGALGGHGGKLGQQAVKSLAVPLK